MDRLRATTAEGLTKYPEREPVSDRCLPLWLQAVQVLLTNGVDEAIHLLCATFLEAEDEAASMDAIIFYVRRECSDD